MHRLPIFLLFLCTIWTGVGLAQTEGSASPAVQDFPSALEAFKKGDFAQSRTTFSALLKQHPQDPTLLYNLGLVELSDNHPGRALAYWRKALYLSPGHGPSLSGLAQLHKIKKLPQEAQMSPLMGLYLRLPIFALLSLGLFFFCACGYFLVRWLQRLKAGQKAPVAGLLLTGFGFITFATLSGHNYAIVHHQMRGTIMEDSVPAYSSPSSEAPSLFNFNEGDEVVVRRKNNGWLQVQKSTTAVGWVKEAQLLIHSGS